MKQERADVPEEDSSQASVEVADSERGGEVGEVTREVKNRWLQF